MAAERHRLSERVDKDLAIGTGSQVATQFFADLGRKLVIDIGR